MLSHIPRGRTQVPCSHIHAYTLHRLQNIQNIKYFLYQIKYRIITIKTITTHHTYVTIMQTLTTHVCHPIKAHLIHTHPLQSRGHLIHTWPLILNITEIQNHCTHTGRWSAQAKCILLQLVFILCPPISNFNCSTPVSHVDHPCFIQHLVISFSPCHPCICPVSTHPYIPSALHSHTTMSLQSPHVHPNPSDPQHPIKMTCLVTSSIVNSVFTPVLNSLLPSCPNVPQKQFEPLKHHCLSTT